MNFQNLRLPDTRNSIALFAIAALIGVLGWSGKPRMPTRKIGSSPASTSTEECRPGQTPCWIASCNLPPSGPGSQNGWVSTPFGTRTQRC